MINTHWKNDDNIMLTLNHNGKVKTHSKAFEGFVNEDVLDHVGWNKSCRSSTKIGRTACSSLDTQATYHQKRFSCVTLSEDQIGYD